MMTSSEKVALQVFQEAVAILAQWAKFDYTFRGNEYPEVKRAKDILGWKDNIKIGTLRLLFDSVNLCDEPKQESSKIHYHKLMAIDNDNKEYPDIPYPLNCEPSETEQKDFKEKINQELSKYLKDNLDNLSLLMLVLEKFGSCLSFGESNESNVALVDMVRTTAAVATALINNPAEEISLIAGDLSGIQKFIYTISSDGALKSLRARSFYLELVTEEIVQQLLEQLELTRTNVIYAGGGNLYILASGKPEVKSIIEKVRHQFNKWFLDEFQGKVFLALDCLCFPKDDLKLEAKAEDKTSKFAEHWTKVTKKLAKHKSCKFSHEINDFIKVTSSHKPCTICHRDDLQSLKPLIDLNQDSSLACWMCRTMFELGDNLFDVKAVLRSKRSKVQEFRVKGSVDRIDLANNYYYFFSKLEDAVNISQDSEIIFLINNWEIENYKSSRIVPLLLGNYGKRSEEKLEYQKDFGFMRAGEMAEKAQGIKRVASLRMDVDRLGQIFAKGLGKNQTLPRLAGLSRQMSYFFKVYLNSLAKKRIGNIPENFKFKQLLPKDEKYNILFIYAGGDDLFITGAWNEAVNFAFDVYQCFRAYTGYNSDITLSGGISIDGAKFPLYQAAKSSGHAEDAAKGNGRNSLGLFGEVFKWDEWLGGENINISDIKIFDHEIKQYLGVNTNLDLFGIFPLVQKLEEQEIEINYTRSFVRNLLDTAQMQNLKIQEIESKRQKEQYEGEIKDIRYYLHLPKIAYSLARLPHEIVNKDGFIPIRKSLLSPYNAPYFRAIATWIELLNRGSES
ncbi:MULTISPECIES: type III-A CRISPR-associated protein Cas10/Csm1 [Aphanizomenon]|jgi:CRISPR-associated protein Csm1|nr:MULTISPECIES: type III-A CRISPR-associated protein Cas10/Csm1 [Aphanizomenon]